MNTKAQWFVIAFVAVIFGGFLTANNSFAQSGGGGSQWVPKQLPLPIGDYQAMAWEKIANISVGTWASSSINATTNDRSSVWLQYQPKAGVVDIDEVLDIIRSQRLSLDVLYTSDMVGLSANLYGTNGLGLLGGGTSMPINKPGDDGVARNTLDVTLNLDDSIWLQFTNAVWYRIVERDANGNPIRAYYPSQYDIQNGMIRYPGYFASKNGELIVTLSDGTEVAYSLGGGGQIIPTQVAVTVGNVSATGFRTFRNTNTVYVAVTPEEYGRNINPLAQFVNTEGTDWVYAAAWFTNYDGSVEFADTVSVWPQGQPSSTAMQFKITTPVHYVPLYLGGRNWIKFGFASGFGETQNQFPPPYQGGGGVGVTTPVSSGGGEGKGVAAE